MGTMDAQCPHCGYGFQAGNDGQPVNKKGFAYWRIADLVLAIATVVVGLVCIVAAVGIFVALYELTLKESSNHWLRLSCSLEC
jgi:hypothetical protein